MKENIAMHCYFATANSMIPSTSRFTSRIVEKQMNMSLDHLYQTICKHHNNPPITKRPHCARVRTFSTTVCENSVATLRLICWRTGGTLPVGGEHSSATVLGDMLPGTLSRTYRGWRVQLRRRCLPRHVLAKGNLTKGVEGLVLCALGEPTVDGG